jgi:hypothetical protein
MKDLKSDYFESLTSFHKPIWIRKHGTLTEFHVDEIKQIRIDVPFNVKDLNIYDQSDMMEVDGEFSFHRYELVDENDQILADISINLKEFETNDRSDMMDIDKESSFDCHELIDLNTRKILDHFISVRSINNTVVIDRISSQAQIINDSLERSPFITVHNRDRSVKLKPITGYSVQAFDSVYARTRTTGDGNCLYSSLSIINIGSEKLTHSMRLLAVNAMLNNIDYFKRLSNVFKCSFEEQIKNTAMDKTWGGEVQIQALSITLAHPIYAYNQFDNNPEYRHYIPSNISMQELTDRFNQRTAGGHFKYIGYKSDMNKLGFCIHFTGNHYDALLPFRNNPQQFIPKNELINMEFIEWKK